MRAHAVVERAVSQSLRQPSSRAQSGRALCPSTYLLTPGSLPHFQAEGRRTPGELSNTAIGKVGLFVMLWTLFGKESTKEEEISLTEKKK